MFVMCMVWFVGNYLFMFQCVEYGVVLIQYVDVQIGFVFDQCMQQVIQLWWQVVVGVSDIGYQDGMVVDILVENEDVVLGVDQGYV